MSNIDSLRQFLELQRNDATTTILKELALGRDEDMICLVASGKETMINEVLMFIDRMDNDEN